MGTVAIDIVEREAARVAAAFGKNEWKFLVRTSGVDGFICYLGPDGLHLDFSINRSNQSPCLFEVGDERDYCQVTLQDGLWRFTSGFRYLEELMVRGLYRLGFDDETVLAQLPSLTAHEKMELRLSMPREFWPASWFDE